MAVDKTASAPGLDEGPHHQSHGKRQGPEWRHLLATAGTWPTSRTTAIEYSLWVQQIGHRREGAGRSAPAAGVGASEPSVQTASTSISRARARTSRGIRSVSRPGHRRPRDADSRGCRFAGQLLTRWASSSCSCAAPEARLTSSLPPLEGALNGFWQTRTSPLAFLFVAPDWSPDGTMVAASATDQQQGLAVVHRPSPGRTAVSSRELYTSDSRIGRARWLPDGSGLLAVVSEALSRQFPPWQAGLFGSSLGRVDLAHRVPGRSRRTTDVRSQPTTTSVAWTSGRTVSAVVERHQFARVGSLDCAGR